MVLIESYHLETYNVASLLTTHIVEILKLNVKN